MKSSTALLLSLAIAATSFNSCSKDSTSTGPVEDLFVPVQISAGVGSTFTSEFVRFDNTGKEWSRESGQFALTNKSANYAGRSGVHVFSAEGHDVWFYQVDAQDNMCEYRPEVNGSIHYNALWQKLPTSGPGATQYVLYDSAMSTPNSHMKQSVMYEFMRKEPFEISGVSYTGSRIRSITLSESTLNGVPFMTTRDTSEYVYIPKLATYGAYKLTYPYNSGTVEYRITSASIR